MKMMNWISTFGLSNVLFFTVYLLSQRLYFLIPMILLFLLLQTLISGASLISVLSFSHFLRAGFTILCFSCDDASVLPLCNFVVFIIFNSERDTIFDLFIISRHHHL